MMITLDNLCEFQYTPPEFSLFLEAMTLHMPRLLSLRNKKPITHHQSPIMSELTFREISKSSPRKMLSNFSSN